MDEMCQLRVERLTEIGEKQGQSKLRPNKNCLKRMLATCILYFI